MPFEVLVATPCAFSRAQQERLPLFQWSSFRVVVFDEAHHVMGEKHPYRTLARSLSLSYSTSSRERPRVVGLTASVSYEVGEAKIEYALKNFCRYLGITNTATASHEELRTCGIDPVRATAELRLFPATATPEGVLPEAERKPHQSATAFFRREAEGSGTRFAFLFMACIRGMEKAVVEAEKRTSSRALPPFTSPMRPDGDLALQEWGGYSHKLAYGAVPSVLLEKYKQHGGDSRGGSNGKSFRGIVFVRERVTTHVLAHVIRSDPNLTGLFITASLYATSKPATASLAVSERETQHAIQSFRDGRVNLLLATAVAEEGMDVPAANCVVCFDAVDHVVSLIQRRGRAREADSSFVVLSQRKDRTTENLEAVEQRQRECLEDFEAQLSNTIAEEFTQSDMGQLDEELPEPRFASMIGRSLYSELNGSEVGDETRTVTDDAPLTAQRCIERAARDLLLNVQELHGLDAVMTAHGTPTPPPAVLRAATEFAKHTNAALNESFRQDPVTRLWVCTLAYESSLRTLSSSGEAVIGKKNARKLAAARLVADILKCTDPTLKDTAAVDADDKASTNDTCDAQDEDVTDTSEQLSASIDGYDMGIELDGREWSDIVSDIDAATARLVAQWHLERAAHGILLGVQERHGLDAVMTAHGRPVPPPGVLSAVTDFAKHTNAALNESFRQDPVTRLWVCTLAYESSLRTLSLSGEAVIGKKNARKLAAARLVAASTNDTWDAQDEDVMDTSEQLSASIDGYDMGIELDGREWSDIVS
eukprot:g12968.t1